MISIWLLLFHWNTFLVMFHMWNLAYFFRSEDKFSLFYSWTFISVLNLSVKEGRNLWKVKTVEICYLFKLQYNRKFLCIGWQFNNCLGRYNQKWQYDRISPLGMYLTVNLYFFGHQDGRIWKEWVSSGVQRRIDMLVIPKPTTPVESITPGPKARPPNRVILPSVSAPEHSILKLLKESGI